MKKKWLMYAAGLFLLVFLFFLSSRPFLVVDEQPKRADVIIVLSGDPGRLAKAAELYHEGYANKVMLSLANEIWLTVEDAAALGIPEESLVLDEQATSTYTNAVYTKALMEKHRFQSAIVVSSDYHMRRVKLSFDRVYESSGMHLFYVASPLSEGPWFFDSRNVLQTAKEWVKLPAYLMKMYRYVDLNM